MNTVRNELLGVLAQLSLEAPELRMGQLIVNLATIARGATIEAPWDVEDDEMLVAARELLSNLKQRDTSVTHTR